MSEITQPESSRSFPDIGPFFMYCMRQIVWPWLLVPLGCAFLFGWLLDHHVFHGLKDFYEFVALKMLQFGVLVTVIRFLVRRDRFLGWLMILAIALCCREIHFVGTSNGVYITLVLLALVLWLKYPWFTGYLASRFNVTLIATAFFCYFIAVTLDQHWWRSFDAVARVDSSLEERMEVLGHGLMLMLFLLARKGDGPILVWPPVEQREETEESDPA